MNSNTNQSPLFTAGTSVTGQPPLPLAEDGPDLIIIGAGPGGYHAAECAAKQGLKVVIFEASEVGGTCLNVGCIPTKTFVYAPSFAEAKARMAEVVPQLRQGVETILAHPNITVVRERGVFTDAHTVSGYTAPNIIIATGSETKWLPIEGVDTDPRVVDSTGLLQLDRQPQRLAIIGAGVIGMEFASVFHSFGSEVTVIEYLKECLPALDSDIAKRLRKHLEKQGITFKMKTAVERLSDIDADVILMATGRKPRVQDDFAVAGIHYDERMGIAVDDHFETNVAGVYAIGDVNGRQMLAHAAEMQAVRVVEHIVTRQSQPQSAADERVGDSPVPAAIFTTPEAACVGPTEDQLRAQGASYVCKKAFWRANGKAVAMGQTEGMLKLFCDADTGRILGCHAYGAHSADIVQEVSVLMCLNATVQQLRHMVHIHPTLGEVLLSAANT